MKECDGFLSNEERLEIAMNKVGTLLHPERLHLERCDECWEMIADLRKRVGLPPLVVKNRHCKDTPQTA